MGATGYQQLYLSNLASDCDTYISWRSMESFFLDKDVSFCFCFFFYYYIYGSLVEKKIGIIKKKKHTLTSTVELIGPLKLHGRGGL
jgi:hypothetical protein